MTDIIDITPIEYYNKVLDAKKLRESRYMSPENRALRNAATILKFTITKQAQAVEELLLNRLLDIGAQINAKYLCVGDKGITYFYDKNLHRDLSKCATTQSLFSTIHLMNTVSTYNQTKEERILESIVCSLGKAMYGSNKVRFSGIVPTHYSSSYTVLTLSLSSQRDSNDTLFCDDSKRYGVYDISTRNLLHTKKEDIISLYFKCGYVTQSCRHPLPAPVVDGIVYINEAIKFINTIKDSCKSPWKTDAIKSVVSNTKGMRWPGYKQFSSIIKSML